MAVCRKRSTNSAPDSLSSSYFTGSPPRGISMMAFTSQGGLRPMGIFEMSMILCLLLRHGSMYRRRIAPHHPQKENQARQRQERRYDEEIEPTDHLDHFAPR